MKRPSLQFYPADWRNNAKLRRASFHDRGVWLDVMCLMHDNDEYGLLRWPLEEIANAVGCRVKDLQSLVAKDILKGGDITCAAYVHTPRHAGKDQEPVTLVPEQAGPLWYSSRMVLDEWNRTRRGGATRFTADSQPTRSPTARIGEEPTGTPDRRQGDGATTSSSSTKNLKPLSGKPDFPDDFEKAWKSYPRRLGDNPKRKALKAWSARLREGHSADELRAGVERYAEFCRTTGKLGTETVKHAATFFGPDKAFLQPWVNLPTEKKVAL